MLPGAALSELGAAVWVTWAVDGGIGGSGSVAFCGLGSMARGRFCPAVSLPRVDERRRFEEFEGGVVEVVKGASTVMSMGSSLTPCGIRGPENVYPSFFRVKAHDG